MTTIKQTMDIPSDRPLRLDLESPDRLPHFFCHGKLNSLEEPEFLK
ncbi:MAG: hypothetical protein LBT38_00275 [Deltaproteobacteria bacterium]|nr:hypothetical protein [Deltaproteobacteria bacterium]